jgi:tripeptide aminopeptidase
VRQTIEPMAERMLEMARLAQPLVVREILQICPIPAPTFAEEARATYVAQRLREFGLTDVTVDPLWNVVARVRGQGSGPTLLFTAHLDTVFPAETDLRVKAEGEILRAPGVGDNTAAVAVLLHVARLLQQGELVPAGDVILAATVGEEGLGNLRGIRAVLDGPGKDAEYVIPLDGSLGGLVAQGVASRRWRLQVTAEGGHSWGAFGAPSAIHAIGRMVAAISEIRVPSAPKTTFNVGLIRGGTTVNTIAAEAEAVLDLRSLSTEELRRLEERVKRLVSQVATETGTFSKWELLGDRPGGSIPADHPLCQLVRSVHERLAIPTRAYPSSTDGNVPLSRGIPAVTVGVTLGGNGHRLDEYIHTTPLIKGIAQVLLLIHGAATLPRRSRLV